MDYGLSPPDLTYLFEHCKRCFVLVAKHDIGRPSIGLPSIFNNIDRLQPNRLIESRQPSKLQPLEEMLHPRKVVEHDETKRRGALPYKAVE